MTRRSDIQGLRAVAVLSVLLFHLGLPLPGGFVGVDVFFVISGYVITGMLNRERERHGRIRFGQFYWRRFTRLTPALAVMVTVTMLVSALALSPLGSQQTAAITGVASMLFAANLVIAHVSGGYFAEPAEANPLLNTWSLSVEDQFYFAFPLVLAMGWWLASRRGGDRVMVALSVGLVGGLSVLLMAAGNLGLSLPGVSVPPSFYSAITRGWEFALGSLLFLIAGLNPPRTRLVGATVGLTGLVLLGSSFAIVTSATPFPSAWTLLPVSATLMLLWSGQGTDAPVGRLLARKPMVWLGDRSYSLYLWHWPLIVFALALWPRLPWVAFAAAGASLIFAAFSYTIVEQRFRHRAIEGPRRTTIFVGVTMAVPLAAAAGLLVTANNGFWMAQGMDLRARDATRLGVEDGCHGPDALLSIEPDACTFNLSGRAAPIYLVGDSYAEVMGDAILPAAVELDRSLTVHSYGGCPFSEATPVMLPQGTEGSPGCRDYVARVLSWLERVDPGAVIIANADFYLRDDEYGVRALSGKSAIDSGSKRVEFAYGLRKAIEKVRAAGHDVYIVQPVPNFRLDNESDTVKRWSGALDCSFVRALTDTCDEAAVDSLDEVAQRQGQIWTMNEEVARQSDSIIMDFAADLCPTGMCAAQQGQTLVYREYLHLTVDGARSLAPTVRSLLEGSGSGAE